MFCFSIQKKSSVCREDTIPPGRAWKGVGTNKGEKFICRRRGVKLRDGIYRKQPLRELTGRAVRHRSGSKDKGCCAGGIITGGN